MCRDPVYWVIKCPLTSCTVIMIRQQIYKYREIIFNKQQKEKTSKYMGKETIHDFEKQDGKRNEMEG